MKKTISLVIIVISLLPVRHSLRAQEKTESSALIKQELLLEDFRQFREILENEHCCTYEYTPKEAMDSLFEVQQEKIDHDMTIYEFYAILAPLTAKIGCMHTSTWLPGRYFVLKKDKIFPLMVHLIDDNLVVEGSLYENEEVPAGSIILEINGKPVEEILSDMRKSTPADALNPHFINAQVEKRFSQYYASLYGLPDHFEVLYALPGRKQSERKRITPVSNERMREHVYAHFHAPLPEFQMLEGNIAAILSINTFIYYDRVEAFSSLMDSCFRLIREKQVPNLILDLRYNGGGDPWCSSVLFSYLEKEPLRYFAEAYRRYDKLAEPIPLAENHFKGKLYTLIDGHCGSTNGHFCALLDYHDIGTFVGTPTGSTYKCNAGKNTELRLDNTQMIITIGRSTYAAAVEGMDPGAPIMPDITVIENYQDYLAGKDPWMEAALTRIRESQ